MPRLHTSIVCPPDIILHGSFTKPSTALAVIEGLGTRLIYIQELAEPGRLLLLLLLSLLWKKQHKTEKKKTTTTTINQQLPSKKQTNKTVQPLSLHSLTQAVYTFCCSQLSMSSMVFSLCKWSQIAKSRSNDYTWQWHVYIMHRPIYSIRTKPTNATHGWTDGRMYRNFNWL